MAVNRNELLCILYAQKDGEMARPKKKEGAKTVTVPTRMDEALHDQAMAYARHHRITLSGLIRSLLRIQTDPQDPREPPPGAEEESRQ